MWETVLTAPSKTNWDVPQRQRSPSVKRRWKPAEHMRHAEVHFSIPVVGRRVKYYLSAEGNDGWMDIVYQVPTATATYACCQPCGEEMALYL